MPGVGGRVRFDESKRVIRVGIKVMIIDDSNTIRRTAEALLKKAGYEVLTAADGHYRSPTGHHFCGHYDAASRWLSDLPID